MTNLLKSNYFYLVILLALFTSMGVFARPDLFGFDSYASLACVKGLDCSVLGSQPLAIALFGLLPNNLIVFKFSMFFCLFVSLLAVFCLVKREFKSESVAWLSTFLVVGLSPIVVFGFGNFENELFAFPLLFWSLYFFTGAGLKTKFVGFLCWLVALGFWLPSLVFLFVFGVFWLPLLVIFIVVLFWQLNKILGFLFPSTGIVEQWFMIGVFQFFLWIFAFPFFARLKSDRWLVVCLVFLFVAMVSTKLQVLFVPFMALGIAQMVVWLQS